MKSLKKYAILAALLGAAVVEAQTAPPPPKALSAAEMRLQAEGIKKQIDADLRHVLHLQALVRKEKDVIKLTCVNDKLMQLKAQMNVYDNADQQLEAAINNTDDSPRTIFADVEKSGAEVKRLRSEADACAGELELYKQESNADVERPELDDPTQGGGFVPPDQVEVEPPGFATPFK